MSIERPYQQCTISVMDTISDPNISFDEQGVCNYYNEYKAAESEFVLKGEEAGKKLKDIITAIKKEGKGKQYDCIIGISGGVDSSYVAYLTKLHGLRPLAVHFDNGWNSELAVKNIENLVTKLNIDLYTLVVNWDEFKDLQLSYLKASVVDIEVVTDHAITGAIGRLAKKYNVKYLLNGWNVVTEAIMPEAWIYNKNDHVNLLDIHKKFGKVPLKTYPVFNRFIKKYTQQVLGVQPVSLLNLVPYNKQDIKKFIQQEFDWRDYGGKHYESIFTKFYQAFILPKKFNIDKRKAHLSSMIFSGQITREAALEALKQPLYTAGELNKDLDFVLKKLGLSMAEFEALMALPVKQHTDYAIEKSVYNQYPLLRFLKPVRDVFLKS